MKVQVVFIFSPVLTGKGYLLLHNEDFFYSQTLHVDTFGVFFFNHAFSLDDLMDFFVVAFHIFVL